MNDGIRKISQHPLITALNRLFFVPLRPIPPQREYASRLLSLLLLIFIPGMLIASTWTWFGPVYRQHMAISALFALGLYFLNRFGFFHLALVGILAIFLVNPYALIYSWEMFGVTAMNSSLPWLMLGIVTGFIVLDLVGTSITIAVFTSSILVFGALEPRVDFNDALYPYLMLLALCGMIFAASVVRRYQARVLAAQQLARIQSDERYQALFYSMNEGIVITSGTRVLDANPAYEALTGYSLHELREMDIRTIVAPESKVLIESVTSTYEPYEIQGVRKDGTRIWVHVQAQPGVYQGQPVRAAVVRDITGLKAIQQHQLELGIEREKVLMLKRFIGNLSHDLRTPLSVIKTSTYLLGKVSDQERRTRHLETLEYETNRLQNMIEDLLNLSRLDRADSSEYQFLLCDVNALAQDCMLDLGTEAERRHHSLTASFAPDLQAIVMDPVEFKRALKHILGNAISYTPEHGAITLTTGMNDLFISVQVADTGPGIAEKDLPHIFERFYRADSARGGSGGTGLGLTIARRVAEAHGGRIEVSSTPGKGTTFTLLLPLVSPHTAQRDKASTNG